MLNVLLLINFQEIIGIRDDCVISGRMVLRSSLITIGHARCAAAVA